MILLSEKGGPYHAGYYKKNKTGISKGRRPGSRGGGFFLFDRNRAFLQGGAANAPPLKLSRSIFFRRIKKFFPKVWQNTPWHL